MRARIEVGDEGGALTLRDVEHMHVVAEAGVRLAGGPAAATEDDELPAGEASAVIRPGPWGWAPHVVNLGAGVGVG